MVESNREHGEGRSDVVIYNPEIGQVAVFEAKYTRSLENLETDCDKAISQIDERMYAKEFEDAYDQVLWNCFFQEKMYRKKQRHS